MEKIKEFWGRGKNVLMIALAIIIELITFWKQFPMLLMNILLFLIVVVFGIIEFQYKKKINNLVESSSNKSDFFAAVITVGITALISNVFYMNNLELPNIRLYLVIAWAAFIVISLIGYITDKIYSVFVERKTNLPNTLIQPSVQHSHSNGVENSQHSSIINTPNSIENQIFNHFTSQKSKFSIGLGNFIKTIIPLFILLLILGAFFAFPFLSMQETISQWFEGVGVLLKSFIGSEDVNKESLLSYICLFIVVIVVLVVFSIIIFNLISNLLFKKRNSVIFLSDEYNNSIITLVTCIAAIRTFVGDGSNNGEINLLTKSWEFALMAIFVLLLLTMLIEIVHLALDQGVRHDSLLRLCIRYIFVLIVKCFVDIIVGVLSNLHLRDVLSSIFSSSFYAGKSNIFDKVMKRIDAAIDKEVQQMSGTAKSKNKIVLNIAKNNTRINIRRNIK